MQNSWVFGKYLLLGLFLSLSSLLKAQNWDIEVLRQVHVHREQSLDKTMLRLSQWEEPLVLIGNIGLLSEAYVSHSLERKQKAWEITTTWAATAGTTWVLKRAINRKRPFEEFPEIQKLDDGGSPSFPSGHTSSAFGFATAISLAYPKWYIVAPSMAWATAVGYSRLHLGVHYPSDVLGGAILGAGCSYISHRLNQKLWQKARLKKKPTLNE
jgi:membrane-associated phospholipid phosphatase